MGMITAPVVSPPTMSGRSESARQETSHSGKARDHGRVDMLQAYQTCGTVRCFCFGSTYPFGFCLGGSLGGVKGISSYEMLLSKCAMQFRWARFLSSDGTMYQGDAAVSVAASIASRARE